MGVSKQDLNLLIQLKEEGHIPSSGAIIEIGAQQLSNDFLTAREAVERMGVLFDAGAGYSLPQPSDTTPAHAAIVHLDPAAPLSRPFWQWLGLDYASIDIDGSPDSIPLDLNCDSVPRGALGKYGLVTNFGTTEHVANQLNAFKAIHDLTSHGGVMVHNVPAQGMANHGLINTIQSSFGH